MILVGRDIVALGMINLLPLCFNKILQCCIEFIRTAVDSGRACFSYSIDYINIRCDCCNSAFHPEASQSVL